MGKQEYWKETLTDILDQYNIDLKEMLDNFIDDIIGAVECEDGYSGNHFIPNPLEDELSRARSRINDLENQLYAVSDNFRKNVAKRWQCSTHDVTLGDDGNVQVRK